MHQHRSPFYTLARILYHQRFFPLKSDANEKSNRHPRNGMKFVTAEESCALEKRIWNNSNAAAKKKTDTHLPLFFQNFKSAHRDKKTHKKQSPFTRSLIRHY